MEEKRINLTERETELINKIGHPVYTTDYIDYWGNVRAKVNKKPQECLLAMGAIGYYQAIKSLIDKNLY
ncbi:hypothetical protein MKA27_19690 [[Clostridium] innocuum]|uniref:hypothetical protein n=1 Tax=Clostridium innocuum TaxID=1522 RepID=UPI000D6B2C0B|nr:hypothetical protein [[Clostridium] innocuum]MCR0316614.1 hypothetical protein [[Clostridium] innocuum]MCR0371903.1 hypothetical protein [[Clostridium] innocuum]MCR0376013.1 hypothetical protein [[Clostridium] innocuum]MCR0561264.1 hypothetical protein [[Clostridium] innocuum]MCR0604530.1 hypothetical protein [[Clostridium] innocuum]